MPHHNWSFQVFRCSSTVILLNCVRLPDQKVEVLVIHLDTEELGVDVSNFAPALKAFYPYDYSRIPAKLRARVRAKLYDLHGDCHCSDCGNDVVRAARHNAHSPRCRCEGCA